MLCASKLNFRELRQHEVRRIPLLRTWVNKGRRNGPHDGYQGTVHTASVIASGRTCYQPKVLRKASVLPITFLGDGSGSVGGDYCGVGGGSYSAPNLFRISSFPLLI
jgi:hypothetical protein